MTDDVVFAKGKFTTALVGFGTGFRGSAKRSEPANRTADQANDNSVEEVIPDARSTVKTKPLVSNIEVRKKAERAASNAGRKSGRPKKMATIGMRCTAKQKMILLALAEHLGTHKQSDVAVEAILMVAAEYDIKGAADELEAVQAERTNRTVAGE